MGSKMRVCVVTFIGGLFLSSVHLENIQYVTKIGNFSYTSETGIIPYNLTIIQNNKDQRLAGCVNISKELRIKNANVMLHRCAFAKSVSECELFSNWTFTSHFKRILYMKNQIWTPLFERIRPRFTDLPTVKKNLYCSPGIHLDEKSIALQYPQFINYYWRYKIICNDINNKKAFIFNFEGSISPYTGENGKRNRKNNPMRS